MVVRSAASMVLCEGVACLSGSMSMGATAAVARTAVRVATYPLDTLKTRQQCDRSRRPKTKGLFDGVGWAILAAAPSGALLLATFDALSAAGVPRVYASAAASVPPLLIKIPLERLKQRRQLDDNSTLLTLDGGGALALREFMFNSVQLGVYDSIFHSSSTDSSALCGAAAAALAAVLSHPVDVVKTRMMASDASCNLVQCARRMYLEEGLGVFTLGIGPRVAHTALGGAAFFAAKELVFNAT